MKRKYIVKNKLTKCSGIYKISCKKSNKVYIGETVNLSQRIIKHFSLLRKNKHSNPILQNMFNKYQEESFIVEVLEYLTTTDEIQLKTIEQQWQCKTPNCISMDSNIVFQVERSNKWLENQRKLLDIQRVKSIEVCQIPICIYDIESKELKEFNSIKEATKLIEYKHLHNNIYNNVLIPYKGKYVAFKKDTFNIEKLKSILNNGSSTQVQVYKNTYLLYNIFTDEYLYFGSKQQFSLYFSNSSNDKLYNLFENKITNNGWCTKVPKTLEELDNMYISIINGSKKFNALVRISDFNKAVKNFSTKSKFAQQCGLSRSTITRGPEIDIYKQLYTKIQEATARLKLV